MNKNNHHNLPTHNATLLAAKDPQPELLEQLYRYQKAKRLQVWLRAGSSVFGLLLTALAAWQGYAYYRHHQLSNQIPASFHGNLNFPIYVPGSSYQLAYQSYTTSNDILGFKVNGAGSEFIFSEQLHPADFELSRYTNGIGISEAREIATPNGSALIGNVHNRNVLIVSIHSTLITVTSSANSASLEALARSLSRI